MNQRGKESSVARHESSSSGKSFVLGLWGVRYQVKDVSRSIAFYTQQLGFELDHKNLPAFAQVSIGNLKLILSGPGASGSRPMPDGGKQEPGGWNRVILQVAELPVRIEALKSAGLHFRNQMEAGPGGKSNWKILTAIPSNCSSRLNNSDSIAPREMVRLYCMTDDALLNTPRTALVMFGAATAIAMAINASMIAYSTTVTPFCLLFLAIYSILG